MIKQMAILARRDGVDAEAFHSHWSMEHARLVCKLPGLVRYVQNDILRMLPRRHLPAIPLCLDGIEELWFRSPEALREAQESPATRAVLADEPTLADAKSVFTVREIVVFDIAGAADRRDKRISLLLHRSALAVAQFQDHWSTIHVEYARAHRFAERYVQNHVIAAERRAKLPSTLPDIDGFGTFLTADLAQMHATYDTSAGQAMNDDARRFVGAVSTYLVRERERSLCPAAADSQHLVSTSGRI
jgi:uncharacterized protein (TIGR02118 family)